MDPSDRERSAENGANGGPASDREDLFRWLLAGEKAREAGAFDLAAEAFANATRFASDSRMAAQIFDSIGHMRWDQKHYDEALEAFRESIFRDGTFAGPWHDIAQIQLARERPEAALESIREAIRRNPVRAKYWNTRGAIETRLGRFAEAAASLRKANELDQGSAQSLATQ